MALCNLADVEAEAKMQGDDVTRLASVQGKAALLQNIKDVSARIETHCDDYFAPYIELRPFDATSQFIDPWRNQLMIDRSLLAVTSVTVGDTVLTAWDGIYANKINSDYTLYPYGKTPAIALQALSTASIWTNGLLGGIGMRMGAIGVLGIWGYRTHYPTLGWLVSGQTVLNNPLTSSGLSISVTDNALFSPGDYIQLQSEICEVQALPSAGTLTVTRGERGSTPASHIATTPISIWQTEPNVQRAAVRFAAYLYKRASVYEKVTVNAAGTYASVMPQDIPEEVANILRQYINIQSAKV